MKCGDHKRNYQSRPATAVKVNFKKAQRKIVLTFNEISMKMCLSLQIKLKLPLLLRLVAAAATDALSDKASDNGDDDD